MGHGKTKSMNQHINNRVVFDIEDDDCMIDNEIIINQQRNNHLDSFSSICSRPAATSGRIINLDADLELEPKGSKHKNKIVLLDDSSSSNRNINIPKEVTINMRPNSVVADHSYQKTSVQKVREQFFIENPVVEPTKNLEQTFIYIPKKVFKATSEKKDGKKKIRKSVIPEKISIDLTSKQTSISFQEMPLKSFKHNSYNYLNSTTENVQSLQSVLKQKTFSNRTFFIAPANALKSAVGVSTLKSAAKKTLQIEPSGNIKLKKLYSVPNILKKRNIKLKRVDNQAINYVTNQNHQVLLSLNPVQQNTNSLVPNTQIQFHQKSTDTVEKINILNQAGEKEGTEVIYPVELKSNYFNNYENYHAMDDCEILGI